MKGTTSWYSVKSCLREGTSGIMANGKKLQDDAFTCASWDFPFGTRLRIIAVDSGRIVEVIVTDRGPAKRLYKRGRILDLSQAAFISLAPLSRGIIKVEIEKLS